MNDVWTSMIGGAAAGLVVSALLELRERVAAKLRRREQIRHIREMIANGRARIYGVPDPFRPLPDGFKGELDSNLVRYRMFEGLRKDLDLALDGRSSEITFDEIRQVRVVFLMDDLIRRDAPGRLLSLEIYDDIFEEWEQIKWLKLPSRAETERESSI